jgi:hypothetical protein
MEEEEIHPLDPASINQVKTRPVVLTILCLFSFVYFSVFSFLFFMGSFWSGWVTQVTNQYSPSEIYSKNQILFTFLAGFILHLTALTGIVLIWNLKRPGYYLTGLSCLIIAFYQSIQPQIAVTTTVTYIFFLISFGLFYKRLH